MLIKETKDMTNSERIAAENSNNLFLKSLYDLLISLKVSEIDENTPAQAYPDVEALKTFLEQFTIDYIVEQGTEGIWRYKKWASGDLICEGEHYIAYMCNENYGNGFYFGGLGRLTYPTNIKFVEPPHFYPAKVTSERTTILTTSDKGTTTNTPALVCISPVQETAFVGETFSFRAIGRWK